MRPIESLVKPEIKALLNINVGDEVLDQLTDDQREVLEALAADDTNLTVSDLLVLLFYIAEVIIPERLAAGEQLDRELVESSIKKVTDMVEVFTPEGYEELMGLYTALLNPVPVVEPVTPVEEWHSQLVEVGMTDLGVLSLEQTRSMDNGTGYVDNYTKLFDKREDGYYHNDTPIATEIFICREAMPRNRLVVMVFRNGKPCGAVFQRFTDNLETWAKCELVPELEKIFSEHTGKETLGAMIGYCKKQLAE